MRPNEDGSPAVDDALDEGDMLLPADGVLENEDPEMAGPRREVGLLDLADQGLRFQAILDQVGDGQDGNAMLRAEPLEMREPGHGPVFVHNLADDARRGEAGQAGEVDGGFGLPRPGQDAPFLGLERKNVPGADQVRWSGRGVDRDLDRPRPVEGRDARGYSLFGVDRDRECRFEP